MELQLRIGALSPSISDQLDEQGIAYDSEQATQWDDWARSIVAMYVRGVITDSERQRINKRLFKHITEGLEQHALIGSMPQGQERENEVVRSRT